MMTDEYKGMISRLHVIFMQTISIDTYIVEMKAYLDSKLTLKTYPETSIQTDELTVTMQAANQLARVN